MAALDRPGAFDDVAGDRPVDLVHLARHTLGDRELEREVLNLFARQSVIYLDRLKHARGAAVKAAAHTIKGSAKGIGAWRVADCAEALETGGERPKGARELIAHLEEAIDQTNGFIRSILDSD